MVLVVMTLTVAERMFREPHKPFQLEVPCILDSTRLANYHFLLIHMKNNEGFIPNE